MYSRASGVAVSGPEWCFTTPPYYRAPYWKCSLPLPTLPDPKIHKKTPLKKGTSFGALLATQAAKKEYSGELGSQNDSKMEPKMEPRQQRPILTKHAQAWSDCMSTPLGS